MSLALTDIACSRIRSTRATTGDASASLRLVSKSMASLASDALSSGSASKTLLALNPSRNESIVSVELADSAPSRSGQNSYGVTFSIAVVLFSTAWRSSFNAGCSRIVRF